MARVVSGAGSWYGRDPNGVNRDRSDNGIQGSGLPSTVPSIALHQSATYKDFYLLIHGGRATVVQHGDLLGAQSKAIDVNPLAARQLGLTATDSKFPTGSRFTAIHLGKNRASAYAQAARLAAQRGVRLYGGPAQNAQALIAKRAPKAPQAASPNSELLRAYLQQRGNPNALLSLAASVKR